MTIKEITAKSILRKRTRIDSWFISCYGMNLYRGCTHSCIYCDGRAETYNVEGEFGTEVAVKVNAIDILRRELDPRRKRKPLKRCFMMIGGGVNDGYQTVDEQYQLTRQALELVHEFDFPAHVLTKSTLVERDLDVLKAIHARQRSIVSFSFSSINDDISAIVEPGVPSPTERLRTFAEFKQEGLFCGMFLMPVIPFLTDSEQELEQAFRKANEIGLDFIIFSGMTLKDGRQKTYFLNVLHQHYPHLLDKYLEIYPGNKWGGASGGYYQALHQRFARVAKRYNIPLRIPASLFNDILSENDLVSVILDQLDYLVKHQGKSLSPHGYAAYAISQRKDPLSSMKGTLQTIKGVGKVTERIILEILETGTSSYYEKLLTGEKECQ